MALPDLTGQNIENTYQRIVQTDGTNFYDGTGSLVNFGGTTFPYTGSAIISGSLIVTGSTKIQYLTAVTSSLDFILVNNNIIPSGNLISDLGNNTNKFRTASLDRVESSNIEINTSGSSPFLIKIEDEPKFEINNEGVVVLGNMTSLPTAITGGLYYSNGSFYMGIE